MYIVQGDHGISIPFTVQKYAVAEDLTGATVEVAIKYGDNDLVRAATITDAVNGECSFTITSSDLAANSVYNWQWTAYFPDGRIYSGRAREFYASERLIAGNAGGGTVPVVIPFATKAELEELRTEVGQGGGGSVPSNVILFEDWAGGESVTIDTSVTPPADTTAPVLTITAGGTFTGTKSVTMSTNETATIYYTLDGSTPTTSSTVYSNPLSISATTTLKAFARDTAGNSSAVQTVTYTLDTTQPADTTAPDNVTNLQYSNLAQTSLTLSWTASASSDVASYDVFNGSTLLANVTGITYNVTGLTASTQYTFTVKAKDVANNTASGASVTVTTSAAPADTTAPVLAITPAATFTDTKTVTMSTNETATIWYTLDDSDPVTSGTRLQYTSPLTLTETDTIKAYAVDSANNASAVQTVTYTKQTVVSSQPTVYFDAADGVASSNTWTAKTGQTATLTNFSHNTTSGWDGGLLLFDSTSPYELVSSTLAENALGTTEGSIEIAFKHNDMSGTGTTNILSIDNDNFSIKSNGAAGVNQFAFQSKYLNTSGTLTSNNFTNTAGITPDVINHYVMTFSGTEGLKLYRNGALIESRVYSNFSSLPATTKIELMKSVARVMPIGVKLLRLYNKALTAQDVTDAHNGLGV